MERGDWPHELGYIGEMSWLREHGVSQDWWQYGALPAGVLEDCQMVMWAQEQVRRTNDTKQPTQDLIAKELREQSVGT